MSLYLTPYDRAIPRAAVQRLEKTKCSGNPQPHNKPAKTQWLTRVSFAYKYLIWTGTVCLHCTGGAGWLNWGPRNSLTWQARWYWLLKLSWHCGLGWLAPLHRAAWASSQDGCSNSKCSKRWLVQAAYLWRPGHRNWYHITSAVSIGQSSHRVRFGEGDVPTSRW